MVAVLLVICLLSWTASSQQLLTVQVSGPVEHVATGGGKVFVSSGDTVYSLSSTLTTTQSVTFASDVLGLAVTQDGQWLVLCRSDFSCQAINSTDIDGDANVSQPSAVAGMDVAVFTATVSGEHSFYTGSYGTLSGLASDLSMRYNQYGFADSSITDRTSVLDADNGFDENERTFFGGFYHSGYGYYIVADRAGLVSQLRIIRVCNDTATTLDYQYEVILRCGSDSIQNPSVVGISIVDDDALVIGFRAVQNNAKVHRICTYSLSGINTKMDNFYESCLVSNGNIDTEVQWLNSPSISCSSISTSPIDKCNFNTDGSMLYAISPTTDVSSTDVPVNNNTILNGGSPLTDGLSASEAFTVDGTNLIYIAYTNNASHYVNKYRWTDSLELFEEYSMNNTVSDITWTEGSDYIYVSSDDQVIGIPLEVCSSATTCSECVELNDPLCGWCVIEGKCSRSSQCQDSDMPERYLTQDRCFSDIIVDPTIYIIELQSAPHEISVTLDPPLPSLLPDESYFCSFTTSNSASVLSIIEGSNGTYTCSVGQIVEGMTDIIKQNTTLSLYSNRTNVSFLTVQESFIFYNCPVVSKCSECVVDGVCGWCVLNFTCTGNNVTCNGGESNWRTATSYQDVCPLLAPNTDTITDYSHPIQVNSDLSLNTLNIPSGLTYNCIFDNMSPVPATVVNETHVTCMATQIGNRNVQEETIPFVLRQSFSGNTYNVESSTGQDINVVLYNCPELAESCTVCLAQNIDTGFNCGWCSSNGGSCLEQSECGDPTMLATESGGCDDPVITDFNPKSGPPQGGTRITINGTNLGVRFSDIVSITIGTRPCVAIEEFYEVGTQIQCNVSASDSSVNRNDTIRITINSTAGNKSGQSQQLYQFLTPSITSIFPSLGPISGGTIITITGSNLNTGNTEDTRIILTASSKRRKRQSCPDLDCTDIKFTSSQIQCTSPNDPEQCSRSVAIEVNGRTFPSDSTFSYQPDPTFISVDPKQIIPAGGINLTFTGTNFNVVQSPTFRITGADFTSNDTVCNSSVSGTELSCISPNFIASTASVGDDIIYTVVVDNATGPDHTDPDLVINYAADPALTGLREESRTLMANADSTQLISIEGRNIDSVTESDISVTVGGEECEGVALSDTFINCEPPARNEEVRVLVTVVIGNLIFPPSDATPEELMAWTLSYELATDNTAFIIGGVVAGLVLIALVAIPIIACIIYYYVTRQSKKSDARFTNLLSQMERMEIEMADECKIAFAELQTDLGAFMAEDTIDNSRLPFHDFATYAAKTLFPNYGITHPVFRPPQVPSGLCNQDLTQLLETFKELLYDKKFLCCFITTLEKQPRFTLQEKSAVASLLMVAFINDLNYSTEVLQVLLGELIRRSIQSQSRSHPKLLLRRTETVAEKLLTNWFCITLYPYVLDHAGPPLFVLFKAIKAQLEKGPIDVMTGEARNSLSEEKLLRKSLEFNSIECEVEMGSAQNLLPEKGVEPFVSSNEDIQTLKLLDTDSVSQAKEKLLDFIYGSRPVSQRPSITDVDLELCRGNAGIILRDHDATTNKEGDWTKINTLSHYNILDIARTAFEDPKKSLPRFRLIPRPNRPASGYNFDVPGTIIASASITSQTSLLAAASPLAQSVDASHRLYHLVKPDAGDDDGAQKKIVSEVFLTRLLSTKRILQPYVDKLFNAMFAIPQDKPLPQAIKTLFDFLDLQAADMNIADPEVLHTWKTNSLFLRFWVNLIKNPDFLFDINKSATVDSCFTVVAQAYIDACSTADTKYSKDTPSARLLYASEVGRYKTQVLSYYDSVHNQPHLSSEETREYFNDCLKAIHEMPQNSYSPSPQFHPDSAVLELYRYAIQHGDSIQEALNDERLTLLGASFSSLRSKYNVNSTPM